VLAAFMVVVGLVVGGNVRSRPADHPQPLDGRRRSSTRAEAEPESASRWGVPVRAAITSRSFVLLALAMFGSSFGFVALAVHQIPYMETQIGVSKAVASSSVAVFTLTSIVGRIGFGYLADRYSKRVMLALALALLAGGMPILAFADSYWQAILGIAIAAPGFGGTVPLRPAMAADYFGLRSFGTINGVVQFVSTTGGAAGPWVVGRIVDIEGEYAAGWLVAAAVVALVGIPAALAATAAATSQPAAARRNRHRGQRERADTRRRELRWKHDELVELAARLLLGWRHGASASRDLEACRAPANGSAGAAARRPARRRGATASRQAHARREVGHAGRWAPRQRGGPRHIVAALQAAHRDRRHQAGSHPRDPGRPPRDAAPAAGVRGTSSEARRRVARE